MNSRWVLKGALVAATGLLGAGLLVGLGRAKADGCPPEPNPVAGIIELLGRLDLSFTQRSAIRSIVGEHKETLVSLGEAERASREDVITVIRQAEVNEAEISSACDRVAALDADLAIERARLYTEINPLLSDSQRNTIRRFADQKRAEMRKQVEQFLLKPNWACLGFDRLDLSDSQKQRVDSVLKSHKSAVTSILKNEKKTRLALVKAIRKPEVDEKSVRAAAAKVAEADKALALERARMYADVYAVLDVDQQVELDLILDELTRKVLEQIQSVINFLKLFF